MSAGARHLYVHLPFCAHRCGYCDFVTVVGRSGQHAAYVDALIRELEVERHTLEPELETVFLGGRRSPSRVRWSGCWLHSRTPARSPSRRILRR